MLSSLFASGLASTYSPTLAVPSVLAHFTSLFGMVRGGTTLYRHLLLSVFISKNVLVTIALYRHHAITAIGKFYISICKGNLFFQFLAHRISF